MNADIQSTHEFIEQFDDMSFHQYLGLTLVEARPGYGKVALHRKDDTPSGIGGSVHGGVLAAVVDIVMLVAILPDLGEDKQPAGTADLGITYLRQAQGDVIYATAEVIKSGRQLAAVEVDITDGEGTLCAKGRTLYAFRAAGARPPVRP